MNTPLLQNLAAISALEETREEENNDFLYFLQSKDDNLVDALAHGLNEQVSANIDCTSCGNCCHSLMINVEPGDPERLSSHLSMTVAELKERYIEESQQGRMIVNTIPCHFLVDKRCSVYDYRFQECREFPHLHKPGFTRRLPGTLLHYGRCPIIYNVVEELKLATGFQSPAEPITADAI